MKASLSITSGMPGIISNELLINNEMFKGLSYQKQRRGIHYYNLPLSMVGNVPHEHWNRLKSRNNHTVLATYQMPYSGHSR
ncbi:hypothetical protein NL676_018698 [Syzygium grande]|nr:hypothetical protein NL676_018698 [Syzygium grande]